MHLVKQVGQIPYHMENHYNYKSTLVCYNNGKYPYLKSEVPGLQIHFLKDKGRLFFWENAAIKYVIKNSQAIDVLNLFHITQESMLYGLLYKYLNPNGILYLKLDMGFPPYKYKVTFSDIGWKEAIHQKMYKLFLKKVDLISIESKIAREKLKPIDNELYQRSFLLRSGIDVERAIEKTGRAAFSEKENLILTVGRIGTEQKNNELLLKALQNINLRNWKVKIIGPVTESFKPKIEAFFREYPRKKASVFFTGEITDRKKLLQYYKKAKIFCLTSRWEGFGTVLVEAQSMGNYLIGTDKIAAMYELTAKGKYGEIVESEDAVQLSLALKQAMRKDFYSKALMNNIIDFSNYYHWPVILEELEMQIKSIEQNR